ncbi:uncharacterized protein [Euphorbia lathyris]|uniref:uncharacterized protein n=1 Tax=Euphorbia lathyris TaxID=212925 RepID=UPI0033131114
MMGDKLGVEIIGTFILVYTFFPATNANRYAKDSHVHLGSQSRARQIEQGEQCEVPVTLVSLHQMAIMVPVNAGSTPNTPNYNSQQLNKKFEGERTEETKCKAIVYAEKHNHTPSDIHSPLEELVN